MRQPSQNQENKCNKLSNTFVSFYATFGTVRFLSNSVKKMTPYAIEPLHDESLPMTQLYIYIIVIILFSYFEGYKSFQCTFSPLVVSRSFSLHNKTLMYKILGPIYAMGFIHATTRRKLTTWFVTIMIIFISFLVKNISYPWRNIVNAGVVAGMTWGCLCMIFGWFRVLNGGTNVDPCLPRRKVYKKMNTT